MRTVDETFGISSAGLAAEAATDPTIQTPTMATTRTQNQPPSNPVKALMDPHGSAIFWIGLASILGLVMVAGQGRVEASLGGRVGRK
jgi:hypothetical protein